MPNAESYSLDWLSRSGTGIIFSSICVVLVVYVGVIYYYCNGLFLYGCVIIIIVIVVLLRKQYESRNHHILALNAELAMFPTGQ